MKNSSSDIVRDFVIIIQMEAPPSGDSGSSGFSLPSIPDEIAGVNIFIILGALVGIIILSFVTYTFVLGPEDTTADIYKPKESIDPLKKSLTGVGYDSELPSKSNLKRLEDRDDGSDDEDEPDEEEYEYEDDDEDEEFDERAMLDKLTGTETLASATDSDDEDEEPEPAPKKKTVKKKAVKKKVVRKVAPAKKETKEPEINMGKGINNITCPACEKVHHIEENTSKFICSCGRRIRV
jgi:hypothetical protein